jgi:hypothetical protein
MAVSRSGVKSVSKSDLSSRISAKADVRERAARASYKAAMDESLPDSLRAYYAKLALFLDNQARKLRDKISQV